MIQTEKTYAVVELTEENAKLFKLFMEYTDQFSFMVKSGVFDIKNGSAELHFGTNGRLVLIKKHTIERVGDYPHIDDFVV